MAPETRSGGPGPSDGPVVRTSVDGLAAEVPQTTAVPIARRGLSFGSILWPVLLSLGTLGVIAYFTFDLESLVEVAPRLSLWFLLLAVATVVVRIFFGAWRLRHFSGGLLGWRASIRCQVAWDFFSYVTPSAVGGSPFVTVFMARDQRLPLSAATSVILFSMVVDQLFLALTIPVLLAWSWFIPVFPAAMGTVGTATMLLVFLAYMAWTVLFAYGTLFRPRVLTRLVLGTASLRWLRRFRPRALRVMAEIEQRAVVLRSQSLGFYAKGFVFSAVPWLSRYLLSVFVIWSLYAHADGLLIFLRSAAIQLGSAVMPTPGGAGGTEGLYWLFFGTDMLPRTLVVPTMFIWRFLSYFVFILAGVFVTMRHLQRSRGLVRSDDG